jgi:gluconate kinase
MQKLFMIMGVTGSGKSTFAELLSKRLTIPVIEADELTADSEDRWYDKIAELVSAYADTGAVLVFSGITAASREALISRLPHEPLLIYLQGDYDTVSVQIQQRDKQHGSSLNLLRAQFDDLEEPEDALFIPLSDDLNFGEEADAVIEHAKLKAK